MVGRIRLTALHTPGHTPEHISFLLTDTPASEDPMGIFTGDFVFVSEVGRPDLLEKAAGIAGSTDGAARALFHSLQRFRDLPDHLQLWPGHGAGSACGRTIGAVPQSTVGYEKMTNWAFKVTDEDRFVEAVLDGQPEPPPYFARMKQINKVGPAPLPAEPPLQPLTPADLHTALAADAPIIDLRPAADYAERHVPGAISLPLNGSFLNWAGWLLPADQPLAFIGAAQQVQAARRLLTLIGLDHIAGFWTPTICGSWATEPSCQTRESLTADQLAHLLADQSITVIDVRKPDEYTAGHIAGSINLPLGSKLNGETPLGAAGPVVVYCQSGERSAIAAGLLQAKGQVEVYNLVGGIQQWLAEGQPTE
jgi:hydroxyacylglutathione hydrolase